MSPSCLKSLQKLPKSNTVISTTLTPMQSSSIAVDDDDDFHCSICLEILYKPCVNVCGHSFCFWCFQMSMNGLSTTHYCPLCRAPFQHFPAVCTPLHRYLAHTFPKKIESRALEIQNLEKQEYHAESPSVKTENFHFQNEFQCQKCSNLACPPTILSCGHVLCCSPSSLSSLERGGGGIKCPVERCVGKAIQEPAICQLMDKIIRENVSGEEYTKAAKKSYQCSSEEHQQQQGETIDDEELEDENHLCIGTKVILCEMQYVAKAQLNGYEATIKSYDSSSKTYMVYLTFPPSGLRTPRVLAVKRKHLKVKTSSSDSLIHYGIGCDGCGIFPIVGRRYRCRDCSEEIGFDICGDCFDAKMHKQCDVGRFNQEHKSNHVMLELREGISIFQRLRRGLDNRSNPLD